MERHGTTGNARERHGMLSILVKKMRNMTRHTEIFDISIYHIIYEIKWNFPDSRSKRMVLCIWKKKELLYIFEVYSLEKYGMLKPGRKTPTTQFLHFFLLLRKQENANNSVSSLFSFWRSRRGSDGLDKWGSKLSRRVEDIVFSFLWKMWHVKLKALQTINLQPFCTFWGGRRYLEGGFKTSQELPILSSVTINCQVT